MPSSRHRFLALLLLLGFGAWLFFDRATENGRRANTDVSGTDQDAYINYAVSIRNDPSFVGGRNRMPAYPSLLALFMDKEGTDLGKPEKKQLIQDFFETGKRINIWLSFVGIIFVGAVFLRRFTLHHGLNILFLTAFCVFAFKAAYVQAEILYYLLTFAVFLLCWSLFHRPRFLPAVLAGGLLGLAHLTKASVLPGLLVFVVFYPLDTLWQLRKSGPRSGIAPLSRLALTVLLAAVFFGTVFPYISKSREIYGQYFYNVNSTFYIWCDSWKEATERTKAADDRKGWPDLHPDEIPSLKNYLRTHSPGEIVWRVVSGCSRVFNSMKGSYGYLGLCMAYLVLAAWITWQKRLLLWRLFLRRPFPILALLAYFIGYFLLIAWYSQIISGNRFVLGLFLPFIFTISVFLVTFARRLSVRFPGGVKFQTLPAFNTIISVWLLVEIIYNCLVRLPSLYSGN